MEKHPLHLKNPELQTSPEVEQAVLRAERATGEKLSNDPSERIEAYMDRLENIFLNPDERKRERNLEMFRGQIYDELIIKKENFPESYFELHQRIERQRGKIVEEIPPDVREEMMNTAIEDQEHSLDAWMKYLTSNDAAYPPWFKYYAWNQVIKLSQFDKERGEFKKRSDSTVAPYPDIYSEALAQIADVYEEYPKIHQEIEPKIQKLRQEKNILRKQLKDANEEEKNRLKNEIAAIDQKVAEISAPLQDFNEKFPTLYAKFTQESIAASMESREGVRGEWVRYEQGDDDAAKELFESLRGKGTGWCTAGRATSREQIETGDMYIFYSNDAAGNPTQPRLAIRMEGDEAIGEVRGVLPHQDVEPLMQETLNEKLAEFGPKADAYRKKNEDMVLLTALEKKYEQGEPFDRNDLVFLYEINSPIEGFGYATDPRVAELRRDRNIEEDMLTVFDCTKDRIAEAQSEITENTKVYIGKLEPGIFQKLPTSVEHIYTSFPEKKIMMQRVEVGGKSAEQLISEMEAAHINIADQARNMMLNEAEFIPTQHSEETILICPTVRDLGFNFSATLGEIYERAHELGLALCPPDTGPNWRLAYRDQPLEGWFHVGMKHGASAEGKTFTFGLEHYDDGLWLHGQMSRPDHKWSALDQLAFRLRKSEG